MLSRIGAVRRPGLRRRDNPESSASSLDDWRRFAAPRFRAYHYLAFCQGVIAVLAGFDVVIPFALEIGCPPALAALLGMLPVVGGLAQLLVPRLLDRTDGDLRRLTILLSAAGETRGLLYALLAIAVAGGFIGGGWAIAVLALMVVLAGALGAVGSANMLAWHSAVLPEQDRRLVVPRLMALSLGLGAALLFPIAMLLDGLAEHIGLLAYVLPFGLSGIAGLIEQLVLRRLPHPGRVVVPRPAQGSAAPESPELRQFLRASAINALGMGVAPYISVYAIAVLGLSAGFTMSLAALGTATMVVAAAVGGARLARGSAAQMLHRSFAIRAAAMAAPILALPGSPLAPLFLCASAMLGAVGFAFGQLAANERLFRLISGPQVIRHHGRYVARSAGAMAVAQLTSGAVLAVGAPLGYAAFASLYGASTALRIVAYRFNLSGQHAPPPKELAAGQPMPVSVQPVARAG